MDKLVVILGPTASGKTAWAFGLCEKFNGEIVSADSRQIYKGMDIGTGKEAPLLYKDGAGGGIISQHLIDIVNPDETLTVSEYKKMAIEKINDIIKRGKIPFLVGGTGLYINAIVDNLDIPEVEPDWKLREELENKNLEELQLQLKKLDPDFYKEIDLNNKRRLIRAIEVSTISKKPFSSMRKKGAPLFDCLQVGIDIPREELIKRIDKRVDEMEEKGMKKEVENLAKKYSWDLPSMSGIGYREFKIPLLYKEGAGGGIFDQIKLHTKQYAKRQMTWFRRDKKITWVEKCDEARKLIADYLGKNF